MKIIKLSELSEILNNSNIYFSGFVHIEDNGKNVFNSALTLKGYSDAFIDRNDFVFTNIGFRVVAATFDATPIVSLDQDDEKVKVNITFNRGTVQTRINLDIPAKFIPSGFKNTFYYEVNGKRYEVGHTLKEAKALFKATARGGNIPYGCPCYLTEVKKSETVQHQGYNVTECTALVLAERLVYLHVNEKQDDSYIVDEMNKAFAVLYEVGTEFKRLLILNVLDRLKELNVGKDHKLLTLILNNI